MEHSICIIGALKDEIAGIKGRMTVHESCPAGSGRAFIGVWHHRRVILVRSGIGRRRAEEALEAIALNHSLSEVVSIGFAGGLIPCLHLGDLVIADAVHEPPPEPGHEISDLIPVDGVLVEKAMSLSFPFDMPRRKGKLVTVDQPLCLPWEKQKLAERLAAVAVEMETSALLRLALAQELPFLSVRAISDTVDHELVDFSHCIDGDGEVNKVKAGWHVITHPGLIPQVTELRRAAQTAAKNLTCFVEEWVKHCP